MKKCTIISLAIAGVLGFLFLVTGIALYFESDRIIRSTVEESVTLRNGSDAFKTWESPPATLHMQFWVFDVENPFAIISAGAKPNVTQRGPYTYRELRTKKDVQFLSNDSLIAYREAKAYVFVPEKSVGSAMNDSFTTVNLPILTAAALLEKSLPGIFLKTVVAPLLSHEHERLFEEHTVHEFLWGYQEKTLKKINDITSKFGYNFSTTVGLFTGRTKNGSDDGIYTVFSGEKDIQRLNEINTWRNKTSLGFWNTTYCNMLNGTDGSMWHPFIKKSERLSLFSSDICRSVYVDYNKTTYVKGIKTYHFVPPATVFMDHIKNPNNTGFCVPECLGSGVLDVSSCKSAPIIVSQPHFYQGSPKYINAIIGMNPGPDHATFVDVEPYTGATLRVAKKLQLNAKITKLKAFKDTNKFDNMTIFPFLWLNESALLDEDGAAKFKSVVYLPINILNGVSYAAMAVGSLLILVVIIFVIVFLVRRKEQDEPLIEQDVPRGDI